MTDNDNDLRGLSPAAKALADVRELKAAGMNPIDRLARIDQARVTNNMQMWLVMLSPGERACTPIERLENNRIEHWRALKEDEPPPADARDWLVAGPLTDEEHVRHSRHQLSPDRIRILIEPARLEPPASALAEGIVPTF